MGWHSHRRDPRPAAALAVVLALAASPVAVPDEGFCEAVEAGDLETVAGRIASGADPDTRACGDSPPLLRALFAKSDSVAMVELLLAHGADPNLANHSGVSPFLLWAGPRTPQDLEKLELLLAHGADVNGAGNGLTPLISAARFFNTRMISALLEHGADPNAQPRGKVNPLAESALQQVARAPVPPITATPEERLAAARLLLQGGARVRRANRAGITPLMTAAASGSVEMVELLLEAGADPHRRAVDGSTARRLARRAGHGEVAKILQMAERRKRTGG